MNCVKKIWYIEATEDNKLRHMRLACWIHKATDTLPEYVTSIAFPLQ